MSRCHLLADLLAEPIEEGDVAITHVAALDGPVQLPPAAGGKAAGVTHHDPLNAMVICRAGAGVMEFGKPGWSIRRHQAVTGTPLRIGNVQAGIAFIELGFEPLPLQSIQGALPHGDSARHQLAVMHQVDPLNNPLNDYWNLMKHQKFNGYFYDLHQFRGYFLHFDHMHLYLMCVVDFNGYFNDF